MSRTRPKPLWWSWKTADHPDKISRRLQRKGQRRVMDRVKAREIEEQS